MSLFPLVSLYIFQAMHILEQFVSLVLELWLDLTHAHKTRTTDL